MHPYVFICGRDASVCTHTPPYASIHLQHAAKRQYIAHIFWETVKSQTHVKAAKIELCFAQRIGPNLINKTNLPTNGEPPNSIWLNTNRYLQPACFVNLCPGAAHEARGAWPWGGGGKGLGGVKCCQWWCFEIWRENKSAINPLNRGFTCDLRRIFIWLKTNETIQGSIHPMC